MSTDMQTPEVRKSENDGLLQQWKERAVKAEAENKRLREVLKGGRTMSVVTDAMNAARAQGFGKRNEGDRTMPEVIPSESDILTATVIVSDHIKHDSVLVHVFIGEIAQAIAAAREAEATLPCGHPAAILGEVYEGEEDCLLCFNERRYWKVERKRAELYHAHKTAAAAREEERREALVEANALKDALKLYSKSAERLCGREGEKE